MKMLKTTEVSACVSACVSAYYLYHGFSHLSILLFEKAWDFPKSVHLTIDKMRDNVKAAGFGRVGCLFLSIDD